MAMAGQDRWAEDGTEDGTLGSPDHWECGGLRKGSHTMDV